MVVSLPAKMLTTKIVREGISYASFNKQKLIFSQSALAFEWDCCAHMITIKTNYNANPN